MQDPNFSYAQLAETLISVLPTEMHVNGLLIAELLTNIINKEITTEEAKEVFSSRYEFINIIQYLSGKSLKLNSNLITFGENNQIGDIHIKDIAGRDIYNVVINTTTHSLGDISRDRLLISDSLLQLVDIGFIETGQFPQIDIKIRNIGGKVAFLKRVDFEIKRVWILQPVFHPLAVPISWNYDIALPTRKSSSPIPKSISQSVAPNEVDRFTFTLGNDNNSGYPESYIFQIVLRIIYDEDNKFIVTQDILFFSGSATEIHGLANDRFYALQAHLTHQRIA